MGIVTSAARAAKFDPMLMKSPLARWARPVLGLCYQRIGEGGADGFAQATLHLLPMAGRWIAAPSADVAEEGPAATRWRELRASRKRHQVAAGADLRSREGATRLRSAPQPSIG